MLAIIGDEENQISNKTILEISNSCTKIGSYICDHEWPLRSYFNLEIFSLLNFSNNRKFNTKYVRKSKLDMIFRVNKVRYKKSSLLSGKAWTIWTKTKVNTVKFIWLETIILSENLNYINFIKNPQIHISFAKYQL